MGRVPGTRRSSDQIDRTRQEHAVVTSSAPPLRKAVFCAIRRALRPRSDPRSPDVRPAVSADRQPRPRPSAGLYPLPIDFGRSYLSGRCGLGPVASIKRMSRSRATKTFPTFPTFPDATPNDGECGECGECFCRRRPARCDFPTLPGAAERAATSRARRPSPLRASGVAASSSPVQAS
jgi:hypothetical protein